MSTSSVEPAALPGSGANASDRFLTSVLGSEPLRAELFGVERLAVHARHLAECSRVAPRAAPGHPLLRRFFENGQALERAYHRITEASKHHEPITPDAEWLLDNFHIVQETLREIRVDMPRGYYDLLPKLADGPFAGWPRVYALALELIAHTDSSLEEGTLTRFVQAYQTVAPLTIGELWAVPIMLRLGLLENLHRLAEQMLQAWADRREAQAWAMGLAAQPSSAPHASADPSLSSLQPPSSWSDSFVVRLLQVCRDQAACGNLGSEWLERQLVGRHIDSREVLRREHQRQAANQVTVGNCVTSLRLLSALDWTVFFERTSLVEGILREDPAGVYSRQDFPTKDRYRQAVERMARGSDHDELAVARLALTLAGRNHEAAIQEKARESAESTAENTRPWGRRTTRSHVGYFLVGVGQGKLEAAIRYRPKLRDRFVRNILGYPTTAYFGSLATLTGIILVALLAYGATAARGLAGGKALLLLLLLATVFVPASELAVAIVHYVITLLLPPRVLPKLDLKEGIPGDCFTFVVMPTMLIRKESARVLTERLEIHHLANPDPHLRFGLLTDFADAPQENMPEDDGYVRDALSGIHALNQRYSNGGPDRFFLFHRKRKWNPAQNRWMGWERKRGKLVEFNRLLRGARDTSYAVISGDLTQVPPVRFVITLDLDTKVPREAIRKLIGTLAHPLNQPRFDPAEGRVVEGYGVLQPRVSLGLIAATRSLFSRVFAASAGVDPYTTAVSDVYQDLFGTGTFTGKGIFEVDAFEAAVGDTFPDNQILSHDLIEGNYVRCGLVTDVELLDDFPAHYHAYARREHRWVRGDWQILPWLFSTVPSPEGKRRNPLPALERWKIFDNLRRSLIPPALILLFTVGWIVLPGSPWLWTGVALLVPLMPLLLLLTGAALNLIRGGGSWQLQLNDLRKNAWATAGQVALTITFLLEQTRSLLDAIVRTLVRLYATHRNLLEWETAASTERRLGTGFKHFGLNMWATVLLAAVLGVLVFTFRRDAFPAAAPFLLAWLLSPLVAFWVSRPLPVADLPLTADERRELRRIARKTWDFFQAFVTAEDHWLPPDNFQENPKSQVAHRTSPTNQGLYLLALLAAHDFGYLGLISLVERLERTFETFDQLEKYRGHFYNWYDTQTLRPLQPGYISTVDSGNLLGCLLALKQGLREKVEEVLVGPALLNGLADTLDLVREAFRKLEVPAAQPVGIFRSLQDDIAQITRQLDEHPTDLLAWEKWLGKIDLQTEELNEHVRILTGSLHTTPEDLQHWVQRLVEKVGERRNDLRTMASWLEPLARLGQRPLVLGVLPRGQGSASGNHSPSSILERWHALYRRLVTPTSIANIQAQRESISRELAALQEVWPAGEGRPPLAELADKMQGWGGADLLIRCQKLADRAGALAAAMNFRILYNEPRHLFAIGYNLVQNRLDNSHYDLLASEARLTSFLIIARGEVPQRHWFHLGRLLTRVHDGIALVSWGGTMFEYLMPRLLLHSYPGTLLDESDRAVVGRQIEYGRERGAPWGISESGFYLLDASLDYQYQSFGVPGLGLKRGLGQDLVIAPYATALALAVQPRAALYNFRRLAAEGAEGPYGFYEATDYTRERLPSKRRSVMVQSYMAHHQGMSLVALANCLCGNPMPRRFHAEPMVRATELLLQERVPLVAPLVEAHGDEAAAVAVVREGTSMVSRRLTTPDTPHPRIHLLSNGRYSVMVTNAGSGYSTFRGLDVTRWREDRTRDAWGQFCYVRDLRAGLLWSAGYQPTGRTPDAYEVVYSTDKAEFHRSDGGIATHLEITVSPENGAEVRRITLANHHSQPHELELTSYAEVVLAAHPDDLAHPAFQKLFLETEYVPAIDALLCRRRPRAADQKEVWGLHVVAVDGPTVGVVQFETDRVRFIGRGRTTANPAALEEGAVLSGTSGPVLDPIFSLRRRVRVAPGTSITVTFTTAAADTRLEALALADQYHTVQGVTRAFELAWAHNQVELRHLQLSAEEAYLYQRLAAYLVFVGSVLRAPDAIAVNQQNQQRLWRFGISGDRPIVFACIAAPEELELLRQLLRAHHFWRMKGLEVDLVFLDDNPTTYMEALYQQVQQLVRASEAHALVDKPGGVFVLQGGKVPEPDKILLQTAARVLFFGDRGSLGTQVDRTEVAVSLPAPLVITEKRRIEDRGSRIEDRGSKSLLFANGWGGFTPDGREYVIDFPSGPLKDKPAGPDGVKVQGAMPKPGAGVLQLPPAPWSNVIANSSFGFLITESGGGYTWAVNSQTNRLTPWNNDPVSDLPGEVIYLRDEGTGEVWTTTPLPLGANAPATVRHGQGYTIFENDSHGLTQELLLLVPPEDPIKLIRLQVRNTGSRKRRLSATFYAEWVLGSVRDQAPMNVLTSLDADSGALLAQNVFNKDFASAVAFADVNLRPRSFTADRTEFLGRNGSTVAPASLGRSGLSGRVGPTLDPCAALMVPFDLQPGEEKEVVFLLGEATGIDTARRLLNEYREPGRVQRVLDEVRNRWDRVLTAVQVRTPNPGMDLLLNRWLLYQVLSCRVWGRSAFYQSGGAYGFRDQLQDVMALVYGAPEETRAHLLRAAARQFLEGDVQHWWHPPAGQGIRTRISDDLHWLPLAACHYIATTGDATVLDEQVPFLKAPVLQPGQEDSYGLPEVSVEKGTLYEHCVRALDHGCRFGTHGLPLMGTGDWNDGMNRVGAAGRGESIWNGWFFLTVYRRFARLAETRGDSARAVRYRELADGLQTSLEKHAWDGWWFLRAFFDDGTPLGSAQNDECRIDCLPQAWAVISGAAAPQHARQAMSAVEEFLVKKPDKLILLFAPPFDKGLLHPGYIKGYLPGIRENGGQYTHGAAWVVQATALLGQGNEAVELFDLLNPIHHTSTPEEVLRYRVEPYVMAGDVYSLPPHVGRGGWTWYTGSASWMYRVGLETILGFHLEGARLTVEPCIPAHWPQFELTYRNRSAVYHITVENPHGLQRGSTTLTVDGTIQEGSVIELKDDGGRHEVRVVLQESKRGASAP